MGDDASVWPEITIGGAAVNTSPFLFTGIADLMGIGDSEFYFENFGYLFESNRFYDCKQIDEYFKKPLEPFDEKSIFEDSNFDNKKNFSTILSPLGVMNESESLFFNESNPSTPKFNLAFFPAKLTYNQKDIS